MVETDPDDEKVSQESITNSFSVNKENQNIEFEEAYNNNFISHSLLNEIPSENPGDDIHYYIPESNKSIIGNKTKRNRG